MNYILTSQKDGIASLTLNSGKVNALNETLVEELQGVLINFANDKNIKAIIINGRGKFFTFGFDIPEFLNYSKADFKRYLTKFTDLYTYIFLYPKPVIAALNGHTIAGGCMMALACDYRIMVSGKAKIALNEIEFGSSVFAGCVEMLRFCVGNRNATNILYSGAMYSAEEAKDLGLIDEVSNVESLIPAARNTAVNLGEKPTNTFISIKSLLRTPIANEMKRKEKDSIKEFADIWYSKSTWENLKKIKIF
ncbi:enoyl-CoA hydratase/isomerase family protein [Bacteroidota bacterium]